MTRIAQLQRRTHALAEQAQELTRLVSGLEKADLADRRLVLDFINDVRAELDVLEGRLNLAQRRSRFVALDQEEMTHDGCP